MNAQWSQTFVLVVFIFVVTSALLVFGFIDQGVWSAVTVTGVFGWLARDYYTKRLYNQSEEMKREQG